MIERYQITEQLGEGGAGSVFKAWDTKLQRYVAIKKLLPPEQRQAAGAGGDLSAEAAALSALQHPHIVAVYDLDTDGPEQFVVMEFINGETLEVTVRRGALVPEDFQQIAAEALDGLNAAHRQGMCHRDIKPTNLMFHWLPDGKWQTKLLDFGLANYGLRPSQQELAGEGSVAGSVHFMAPEQFLRQPLDVRSDLYSLGCVLYYALTGSYPCNGATVDEVMKAHLARQVAPLQSLRPDVNPLLTDWVMWLMSRQPEERPETATEALRVLRGILSGELRTLPVQRALKTQPVPRRTTVVAAPLNKDAAARARSAESTGMVEALPAVTAPRPSIPVPARGAAPANSAAGKSPAAEPPPAPAAAKSKTPLIAGLAAAVVFAGALIYFLTRGGGDEKHEANGGDGPAVKLGEGAPPGEDLVIWFDAAQGAHKDDGKSPASPGDRVDQWDDRAVLHGNNPAQYHLSGTQADERAKRYPTLERVSDTGGLKGTHDVMTFDGGNCLVFARDRDKVGDPVAKELSGNQLTWIAVFSAAAGAEPQGLLCARAGGEQRAWDSFVRDGFIYSGVRQKGGAENHAALPFAAGGKFHILAVVWDGAHDRLRQWLTGPDGRTAMSTAISGTTDFGDLEDIRIGGMNHSPRSGPAEDFLNGGIACLLLYNRAMEDAERHAAVDYLARRYFGAPAEKK